MKAPVIIGCLIIAAMAYGLFGCATTSAVDAIQKSCDDPDAEQTVINGHAYACIDYNTFVAWLQAVQKKLAAKGSRSI